MSAPGRLAVARPLAAANALLRMFGAVGRLEILETHSFAFACIWSLGHLVIESLMTK
jgi:hypothetical protein